MCSPKLFKLLANVARAETTTLVSSGQRSVLNRAARRTKRLAAG